MLQPHLRCTCHIRRNFDWVEILQYSCGLYMYLGIPHLHGFIDAFFLKAQRYCEYIVDCSHAPQAFAISCDITAVPEVFFRLRRTHEGHHAVKRPGFLNFALVLFLVICLCLSIFAQL